MRIENKVTKVYNTLIPVRKPILFLILATLLGMSAFARSLSPSEALARAAGHPFSSVSRSSVSQQPVMTVGTDQAPALYVFDKGTDNGFLIVAADDVAAPVIAYSDSGSFDPENLPANLRGWLELCGRQIREASAAGVETYSRASSPDRDPIAPLMTTKWDQGAPYYDFCPTVNGIRTYTGCVATAMAQVMKYYNWPEKASENALLKYNWIRDGAPTSVLTADFSNFRFDWDNMLDNYRGVAYNDAQAEAVAKLMQACGYSVEMRYNISASGAFSESVGYALVNYFGYDAGLHNEPRDLYTSSQWEDMIYENLRTCGPVVYWGAGDAGAHCFVCDGYQSGGYFHINWGWSGMSDGYFLLNILCPTDLGIGGGSGGFNSAQGALLGVKPATDTEAKRRYTFRTTAGITAASTNGTYVYLYGMFKNYSPYTVNGKFVLRLYNEDGTEYIRSCTVYTPSSAKNFGLYSATSTILGVVPNTVPDGTYRIYPAIEVDGEEYEFRSPPGGAGYVVYTRQNGRNTASLPDVGQMMVEDLSTNGDIYAGKPFRVTGTARFTGKDDANLYVVASLLKADGSVCGYGTRLTLTFSDRGNPFEFVSDWFMNGTASARVEAGDYTFALQFYNDAESRYETIASCPVKVLDNAPAGTYEVTALEVDKADGVDPADICITAHVRGLTGVVYENLIFVVSKGGANVWQNHLPFFASAGQSTSVSISASLPEAKPGEKYDVRCWRNVGGRYEAKSDIVSFVVAGQSGIDSVGEDDVNAPVEYFNLQGQRVSGTSLAPGIYLRRQGAKVSKILVR